MVRRPFSTSPSYLQYIRSLRDLHALTLAGRDESPEADAIRDGMDQPWYDLSEVEQKRIKGLSEDLYSISDSPHQPEASNSQIQRKLQEAFEARRAGNWDWSLQLLRRWSRFTDPALLSFLRGSIWAEAGDFATANLFYEHAAKCDPQTYERVFLDNLSKVHADAAYDFATVILDDQEIHSPGVVVTAASVLFDATRYPSLGKPQVVFERLMAALEQSLSRMERGDAEDRMPDEEFRTIAFLLLAGCSERLGDLRRAIRHLNAAIALEPDDVLILEMRGILRYGSESGALADFQRAADLGPQTVWPDFYLAHHALVDGQYNDCLHHCDRGLRFEASDEIRGMLHEWLAISRAQLRYPADQVRSAFEAAIRLAPDSDRIRSNLAAFERALANPDGPKLDWIKLKASTVQTFGRSEFRLSWPFSPIAA